MAVRLGRSVCLVAFQTCFVHDRFGFRILVKLFSCRFLLGAILIFVSWRPSLPL